MKMWETWEKIHALPTDMLRTALVEFALMKRSLMILPNIIMWKYSSVGKRCLPEGTLCSASSVGRLLARRERGLGACFPEGPISGGPSSEEHLRLDVRLEDNLVVDTLIMGPNCCTDILHPLSDWSVGRPVRSI